MNPLLYVIFPEAPSFAQRMEDQVTSVGSTTLLQCMTSGSPQPKLTWLKDGVVLVPTLRHFFTANDQLLIIVQTAVTDTGNYTCVMTNVLGSDRQVKHSSQVCFIYWSKAKRWTPKQFVALDGLHKT